jgi:hypothetical protein
VPSTTADDNSGLDEPLQRKNEVLRAINEYSLALTSVASTDNLFKIIGDRLKAAVDAMGVAVASYDASSSDLIVRPGMKVLYISGYTEDELPGRPAAEGGAAFLAKPFLPVQLALKVREILDPPA